MYYDFHKNIKQKKLQKNININNNNNNYNNYLFLSTRSAY